MDGYDIDGVLVPLNVKPGNDFVIISGRLYTDWKRTIQEVGQYEMPIYLRPNGSSEDGVAAAIWKSEIINKLGVTKFFEDNKLQAEIIRGQCPGCEVHLLGQKVFKILMIEAKSSWIGKLLKFVDGKYVEVCRGRSFKQNEKSLALESIVKQADALGYFDAPIEYDEWFGC